MTLGVVIPTKRPELLAAWWEKWLDVLDDAELFIVHDGPVAMHVRDLPEAIHLCWADIERWFPHNLDNVISRRSDAVRCLGFIEAYRRGVDVVLTVDDDVTPNGFKLRSPVAEWPWLNHTPDAHARGLPVHRAGRCWPLAAVSYLPAGDADVAAFWRLAHGDIESTLGKLGVVPPGQYMPLSSLCLAVWRDFVPLWYFPPQGKGQAFNRWGDIWAGLILTRVAEHLRRHIAWVGGQVVHRCLSDPFVAMEQEAPGLKLHEELWGRIDRLILTADTPFSCALQVAEWLQCQQEPYLAAWGRNFALWLGVLAEFD